MLSFSSLDRDGRPLLPVRTVETVNYADFDATEYTDALVQFNQNASQIFQDYIYSNDNLENIYRKFKTSFLFKDGEYYFIDDVNKRYILLPEKMAQLIHVVGQIVDDRLNIRQQQQVPYFHPLLKLDSPKNAVIPVFPLPDELIKIIFSYLSFNSIQELRKTARFFLKEFNINVLDSKLFIRELFNRNFKDRPQFNLSDFELNHLASFGKDLRSVILRNCSFSKKEFITYLQSNPKLESLEFDQFVCDNFDEYLALLPKYAPQLTTVKVVDCKNCTDESLHSLSLLRNLISFEYWDSQGQSQFSDYGMIRLVSNRENPFQTFKLTGCPLVTQASLVVLVESKKNGAEFSNGRALEHFGFSYCGASDELLLNTLRVNCPNLKALELGYTTRYSLGSAQKQQALANLLGHSYELNNLKISDCSFLTAEMIKVYITTHQNTLRQLQLYRCFGVTPAIFAHLSKCPLIETLKIQPRDNLAPFPWSILLLKDCLRLKALSLFNCMIDLSELNKFLHNKALLRELELHHSGLLNSSLLKTLAKYCPKLGSLEIQQGGGKDFNFDNEGLNALVDGCKDLTFLHLSYASKNFKPVKSCFTSDVLVTLAKSLSELRSLTLGGLDLSENHLQSFENFSFFQRHATKLERCLFPNTQNLKPDDNNVIVEEFKDNLITLT